MSHITHPDKAVNNVGLVVRIVVLAAIACILLLLAVSFAVNHMRLGFEKEYRAIHEYKLKTIATNVSLSISGDEIALDPVTASQKYASVLGLMIQKSDRESFSSLDYGLYAYSTGELIVMYETNPDRMMARKKQVSDWFTKDSSMSLFQEENTSSVFVPIFDSQGNMRGLFELNGEFSELDQYGRNIEQNLLKTVLVVILISLVLFSLQYIIPVIFKIATNNRKGGSSIE